MDVGTALPLARFFDGRHAKGQGVSVAVRDGSILIQSEEGAIAWTLREVTAQLAPDGAVSVSRRGNPARLVVCDPVVLHALQAALRRWPRRQSGWKVAVAAAAGLLTGAALLVAALPSLLAPLVPPSWEASTGRTAEASLLASHHRCTGADGQRALDRLAERLADAGGITGPMHLVVSDDTLVNAFTLPGNHVVVMGGLIAKLSDGDELAGVLAHELGHVAHRDPVRQLLRQLGLGVVGAAFGWGDFDSGGIAATLLGLSYGRAAEASADAFAISTLRAAGLRADGLSRFFTVIEADSGSGIGFLSDHPPTADRKVQALQPADGAPAFDAAEWQAIRGMCSQ